MFVFDEIDGYKHVIFDKTEGDKGSFLIKNEGNLHPYQKILTTIHVFQGIMFFQGKTF